MPIFSYYNYFQFASVLIGLVLMRSTLKASFFWLFLLSLSGFLIDFTSRLVIIAGFPNNYFIINLYHTVAGPITYYGFYKQLHLKTENQVLYRIVTSVFTVFLVASYFYYLKKDELATIPIIFFNFFNSILCCGMLFKMAMEEKIIKFSGEPMFWLSAAILIFSLGALVTMGMNQYIRANRLTIHNQVLYRVIMPVLNVILYGTFSYVFILCRVKKKSYSQ